MYIFVRHLGFWEESQRETRIKSVIDRILIRMDFFFLSIFDKYQNYIYIYIYIWKTVNTILWIYWRDYYYILAKKLTDNQFDTLEKLIE